MLLLFLLICSFAVSIDSRLDGRPPKDVCENIVNWVCDPDGILSSDSKETVEAYLNAITKAHITVAIIQKMNDIEMITAKGSDYSGKYYSDFILNQRAMKNSLVEKNESCSSAFPSLPDCAADPENKSIVIFISAQDGILQISTAPSISKIIEKSHLRSIILSAKSYLRRRIVSYAIESTIIAIDLLLSGNKGEIFAKYGDQFSNRYGPDSNHPPEISIIVFFVIFVVIILAVGRYHDESLKKTLVRGKEILKTMLTEVLNNKHADDGLGCFVMSCPECLETYGGDEKRKLVLENCHHSCCSSCLTGVLGLFGARVCPICRSPIIRYHTNIEDEKTNGAVLFESRRNDICYRLRRAHDLFKGSISETLLNKIIISIDRRNFEEFAGHLPANWRDKSD